jgi:hypothetical protein
MTSWRREDHGELPGMSAFAHQDPFGAAVA